MNKKTLATVIILTFLSGVLGFEIRQQNKLIDNERLKGCRLYLMLTDPMFEVPQDKTIQDIASVRCYLTTTKYGSDWVDGL